MNTWRTSAPPRHRRIRCSAATQVNTLTVAGSLNARTAGELADVLARMATLTRPTAVNLRAVRSADPAGVWPIIDSVHRRAAERQAPLRISAASELVCRAFSQAGYDLRFGVDLTP